MDKILQDLFYQYNEDMYKINEMEITTDKKMAEDFITYTKNKMKSFKTHNHKIYIEKHYDAETHSYGFEVYVNNTPVEEIHYDVQYDHNFSYHYFLGIYIFTS
jgi:hypothetical protein